VLLKRLSVLVFIEHGTSRKRLTIASPAAPSRSPLSVPGMALLSPRSQAFYIPSARTHAGHWAGAEARLRPSSLAAMIVFISSVRRGLESERDYLPSLLQASGYEARRFEDFSAQPSPSRDACLAGVEAADVYLLLLGERFGEPLPDTGKGTDGRGTHGREAARYPNPCLPEDGRRP
jgi:hypothetical protein